jgi:membrane protease YdiL (CAAX protease family)
MNGPEFLIPITMVIAPAALIFGIAYMRTRENLAMIEKGMNPKENFKPRPAPFRYLKWALLLIGAGVGLFIAFLLHQFVFYGLTSGNHHDGEEVAAIYFALIAIGGGMGLFYSYMLEKKWWDKQDDKINKE